MTWSFCGLCWGDNGSTAVKSNGDCPYVAAPERKAHYDHYGDARVLSRWQPIDVGVDAAADDACPKPSAGSITTRGKKTITNTSIDTSTKANALASTDGLRHQPSLISIGSILQQAFLADVVLGAPLPNCSTVGGTRGGPAVGVHLQQLVREVMIGDFLGAGSSGGKVFKGTWRGSVVALKLMVSLDLDDLQLTTREALLSRSLSHPHLVQTYAVHVSQLAAQDLDPATYVPAAATRSGTPRRRRRHGGGGRTPSGLARGLEGGEAEGEVRDGGGTGETDLAADEEEDDPGESSLVNRLLDTQLLLTGTSGLEESALGSNFPTSSGLLADARHRQQLGASGASTSVSRAASGTAHLVSGAGTGWATPAESASATTANSGLRELTVAGVAGPAALHNISTAVPHGTHAVPTVSGPAAGSQPRSASWGQPAVAAAATAAAGGTAPQQLRALRSLPSCPGLPTTTTTTALPGARVLDATATTAGASAAAAASSCDVSSPPAPAPGTPGAATAAAATTITTTTTTTTGEVASGDDNADAAEGAPRTRMTPGTPPACMPTPPKSTVVAVAAAAVAAAAVIKSCPMTAQCPPASAETAPETGSFAFEDAAQEGRGEASTSAEAPLETVRLWLRHHHNQQQQRQQEDQDQDRHSHLHHQQQGQHHRAHEEPEEPGGQQRVSDTNANTAQDLAFWSGPQRSPSRQPQPQLQTLSGPAAEQHMEHQRQRWSRALGLPNTASQGEATRAAVEATAPERSLPLVPAQEGTTREEAASSGIAVTVEGQQGKGQGQDADRGVLIGPLGAALRESALAPAGSEFRPRSRLHSSLVAEPHAASSPSLMQPPKEEPLLQQPQQQRQVVKESSSTLEPFRAMQALVRVQSAIVGALVPPGLLCRTASATATSGVAAAAAPAAEGTGGPQSSGPSPDADPEAAPALCDGGGSVGDVYSGNRPSPFGPRSLSRVPPRSISFQTRQDLFSRLPHDHNHHHHHQQATALPAMRAAAAVAPPTAALGAGPPSLQSPHRPKEAASTATATACQPAVTGTMAGGASGSGAGSGSGVGAASFSRAGRGAGSASAALLTSNVSRLLRELHTMGAAPGRFLTVVVMEYCERGNLMQLINQQQQQQQQQMVAGSPDASVGWAGSWEGVESPWGRSLLSMVASNTRRRAGNLPSGPPQLGGVAGSCLVGEVGAGPAGPAAGDATSPGPGPASRSGSGPGVAGSGAAGCGGSGGSGSFRRVEQLRNALEIAQGMAYLHSLGLVHGDLKPANVLLRSTADGGELSSAAAMAVPPGSSPHHSVAAGQEAGPLESFSSGNPAVHLPGGRHGSNGHMVVGGVGGSVGGGEVSRRLVGPTGQQPVSRPRGYCCKIADFGLTSPVPPSPAAAGSGGRRQDPNMSCGLGAVSYMAPEVAGGEPHGMPADVYSYGVLLWTLVSGQAPHAHLHPAQILVGLVSGELELQWPDRAEPTLRKIGAACTAWDPAARPTFEHIVRALLKAVAKMTVRRRLAPPGTPLQAAAAAAAAAAPVLPAASPWQQLTGDQSCGGCMTSGGFSRTPGVSGDGDGGGGGSGWGVVMMTAPGAAVEGGRFPDACVLSYRGPLPSPRPAVDWVAPSAFLISSYPATLPVQQQQQQ